MRDLTVYEVEEVAGSSPGHVASAIVGGMAGGMSAYLSSGGNLKAAAAGAATGVVIGLINPASSAVKAAQVVRTAHATLVGGVAGAGIGATSR